MTWTSPQICYVPIRSPGDAGGSKERKTEWGKIQKLYSTKVPKQNTKKVKLKARPPRRKLIANENATHKWVNKHKIGAS